VIPAAPGATADFVGRTIAAKLGEYLGQPIVIENRPGGGETFGAEAVAKAPPDGYTLLLVTTAFAASPAVQAKLAYDAAKDLAPVALLLSYPQVLVAGAGFPVDSVQEVIALAKANPGRLQYAAAAAGSSSQLAAELFKSLTSVQLTRVSYKGIGPPIAELVSDHALLLFTEMPLVEAQVKSGKLKALAVTGPKRLASALNVPTMIESGVPDYDLVNWYGVMVPAGTPRSIIDRLNADLRKTLGHADVRDKVAASLGADVAVSTPEAFGALLRKEFVLWAKLVKEMSIKAE
jgi:tripartite-type tricarboxylate transporter receptor subunit TctC